MVSIQVQPSASKNFQDKTTNCGWLVVSFIHINTFAELLWGIKAIQSFHQNSLNTSDLLHKHNNKDHRNYPGLDNYIDNQKNELLSLIIPAGIKSVMLIACLALTHVENISTETLPMQVIFLLMQSVSCNSEYASEQDTRNQEVGTIEEGVVMQEEPGGWQEGLVAQIMANLFLNMLMLLHYLHYETGAFIKNKNPCTICRIVGGLLCRALDVSK
ncbi:hypothetical protein ACJX0J_029805, partial [Zea mays]